MKNDCIFCAIAAGEIPCCKIYEDDLVLAFLDINPFATGHTLVVPKAHTTDLLDTSEEVVAALIARVKKVAAQLKEKLPCEGFNILQNNGVVAGQTVPHIHFHIVPRRASATADDITFVNHKGDREALAALVKKLAF